MIKCACKQIYRGNMPVTELYAFNLICENLLAALYGVAFILGTWDGIDENGQADKTVRKLRQGDVITPVYYTYDENGEYVDDMTGDEYVYDGDTKVYDNFLPSADYLYSFCIEDIFGNSSYTDFVTFNVDDSGAVSFYID